MEKLLFWCINTDFDYNKAVTINITDGRYFDKSFPSDSVCYIINDIAAGVLKNKNPAGSTLILEGQKGIIVGVFKDFHTIDLAGPFVPTIITLKKENRNYVLIKFSSGSYFEINKKIAQVYKHYEPELPYHSALYNDLPDYAGLGTPSNLIGLAFFIALLLGCLGLSGLASFTIESRTKEIGIRKTNGATILSIVRLLAGGYTRWLIITFIISLPVAFFLGKIFLARFHFHTIMPFWPFLAGPAITYFIALLTVSWQSWRAATRNPVEALRYE
jgi:ABC-type antimicrobial peptide transport system permease subunit